MCKCTPSLRHRTPTAHQNWHITHVLRCVLCNEVWSYVSRIRTFRLSNSSSVPSYWSLYLSPSSYVSLFSSNCFFLELTLNLPKITTHISIMRRPIPNTLSFEWLHYIIGAILCSDTKRVWCPSLFLRLVFSKSLPTNYIILSKQINEAIKVA